MNNLKRMIVIPPEIFEKFKHIVLEDNHLSSLDKNMKSILYNKELSDLNKWHLYRQHLINYSTLKRKKAHTFSWPPKHVEGVGVQTKRIFIKEKDTQTQQPQLFHNSTQTINIPIIPEFEGVGDLSISESQQQQYASNDDNDDEDDDEEVFNRDIEKQYDQRDVLNIRDYKDHKTVEMKSGDVLTIPKFQKPAKPSQKHKSHYRKGTDGYLQTEINFPQRKSSRPATVETISRSQSLRSLPKEKQDWTKFT